MKNKYIFGGFIIVVFLGLMMYLFTQSNIEYADDFAKVKTTTKTVKATGSWVKEKNYNINKNEKTFSFFIADENGNEMKVIYEGTIPNNFESATSVVVTGKYQNGYFHAKDILTKCPSKYEEQQTSSSSL
ncbi:MAG: cytochrome c maturation protein CcmE [Ignavibacteria bacterium]|nr:cytochrome c maturation protein CcmE [Ignavibacteria bacterium]MBT8382448.1 cytochrome c maturation protein CcmE [Ignavibacteria bacterium]MBT8392825.1 cytochrome c maturation protein CcmE [Ignavibacteria bacterium]NNJ53603.1 cytochrome c maturation protein CcmE [Ignavibacteriaceae bacterium]NNL20210.1 cytochrome c maturation protein CcmE [Ignavibacteriaceae bacterium]